MFDAALNSRLGLQAELAQVKGTLRRAQTCRELQDAEPGWNEQVHSRVLELALEGQARTTFQNMYASLHYEPATPSITHVSVKILQIA